MFSPLVQFYTGQECIAVSSQAGVLLQMPNGSYHPWQLIDGTVNNLSEFKKKERKGARVNMKNTTTVLDSSGCIQSTVEIAFIVYTTGVVWLQPDSVKEERGEGGCCDDARKQKTWCEEKEGEKLWRIEGTILTNTYSRVLPDRANTYLYPPMLDQDRDWEWNQIDK